MGKMFKFMVILTVVCGFTTSSTQKVRAFNARTEANNLDRLLRSTRPVEEKDIFNFMIKFKQSERSNIAEAYERNIRTSLATALQTKLKESPLKDLVMGMAMPLNEYFAKELNRDYTNGWNYGAIYDVLLYSSNQQKEEIRTAYTKLRFGDLRQQLRSAALPETFKNEFFNKERYETEMVNYDMAKTDAKTIYNALNGKNEASISMIFLNRAFVQLKLTYKYYKILYNHDMVDDLKNFKGNSKDTLKKFLEYYRSPEAYFRDRLYEASHAYPEKNGVLNRIILARLDIDFQTLRQDYEQEYYFNLDSAIKAKFKDEQYKNALLQIIRGTGAEASYYHPDDDARELYAAIDRWGTNENTIIKILTRRTLNQRLAIKAAYTRIYRRSLVADLEDDLSGDFKTLMLALIMPMAEYKARLLVGAKEESEVVTDVLLDSDNTELMAIKKAFKDLKLAAGHKNLPVLLARYKQYVTPKMVRKAFAGMRHTSPDMNDLDIIEDVKLLRDGTPMQVEYIITMRSFKQLSKIFQKYEQMRYGHIEDAFDDRNFNDVLKAAIQDCIEYTKSKTKFFARRLHDSMYRAGTNDDMLTRVIVTHAENDLKTIAKQFDLMYGQSLSSFIYDDTSGDYRKALLALVEK